MYKEFNCLIVLSNASIFVQYTVKKKKEFNDYFEMNKFFTKNCQNAFQPIFTMFEKEFKIIENSLQRIANCGEKDQIMIR